MFVSRLAFLLPIVGVATEANADVACTTGTTCDNIKGRTGVGMLQTSLANSDLLELENTEEYQTPFASGRHSPHTYYQLAKKAKESYDDEQDCVCNPTSLCARRRSTGWCYTKVGACKADGKKSTKYEADWSAKACEKSCACNKKQTNGNVCTRRRSGGWCYTKRGVCSDGKKSTKFDYDWSPEPCTKLADAAWMNLLEEDTVDTKEGKNDDDEDEEGAENNEEGGEDADYSEGSPSTP